MDPRISATLRTGRLLLRAWDPADAPTLAPLLAANAAHLGPWIPPRVAAASSLPEVAERLAGFAADFAADRAYRWALLTPDGTRLLGEVDLFPRSAAGRVPLADADGAEIGYWLDAAATGQGLATEAARALVELADTVPAFTHVEIRCSARNAPSAAVPRRLGFHLSRVEEGELQVWRCRLHRSVTLRRLGPGDERLLVQAADGVFDGPVVPAWTDAFLNDPRHHLIVALDAGRVVGMVSAVDYVHPDQAPQLWINEVGVAPSHQRRGIGRRLLDAMLAHGRARGCTNAWLAASPGNRAANALYEGAGVAPEPALVYAWPLAAAPRVESSLGLRRGTVRLVPHDPSWPARFRAEAARVEAYVAAAGLPPLAFAHVGSTAVPGLVAKPIIDFLAGHEPGVDPRRYHAALRDAGYAYRGPQGVAERELFVLGPEAGRTHHLNLVPADGAFWRDHLAFRDRLRRDPAVAAAYAALKERLAARFANERVAYTEGKEAFVRRVVAGADPPVEDASAEGARVEA